MGIENLLALTPTSDISSFLKPNQSADSSDGFLAILEKALSGPDNDQAYQPPQVATPYENRPVDNSSNENRQEADRPPEATARVDVQNPRPETSRNDPNQADAAQAKANTKPAAKTADTENPQRPVKPTVPQSTSHPVRENDKTRTHGEGHTVPTADSLAAAHNQAQKPATAENAKVDLHEKAKTAYLDPVSQGAARQNAASKASDAKKLAQKETGPRLPGHETEGEAPAKTGKPDARAETAARKMAALDQKGVNAALEVVKNIAHELGVAGPADAVRSHQVVMSGLQTAALKNVHQPVAQPNANGKLELGKNDRKPPLAADSLRAGVGEGVKLQLTDVRGMNAQGSVTLENLLAERITSGAPTKSSADGNSGSGADKSSLQLLNTAFFSPSGPTSTMTIPVVATQQSNLQQALKTYLDKTGNGDIVQQARIIMNSNDNGEIRLILKPESLGEVRINMNMKDGRIDGTIFVENKDVQQAFQDNMGSLLQAFEDGGLSAGALNITVSDRNGGNASYGGNSGSEEGEKRKRDYAVSSLEHNVSRLQTIERDYGSVNLVV